MTGVKKRASARKPGKAKASGQKSLFDHFQIKPNPLKQAAAESVPEPDEPRQAPRNAAEATPEVEVLDVPEDSSSSKVICIEPLSHEDEVVVISEGDEQEAAPEPSRKLRPKENKTKYSTRPIRPHGAATPDAREVVDGNSRDAPIVVVSSPIRPPAMSSKRPVTDAPAKPFYSIFAPRAITVVRSPSEDEPGEKKPAQPVPRARATKFSKDHFTSTAPFPDCDQLHVRGPQTTFLTPDICLPPRVVSVDENVQPAPSPVAVEIDQEEQASGFPSSSSSSCLETVLSLSPSTLSADGLESGASSTPLTQELTVVVDDDEHTSSDSTKTDQELASQDHVSHIVDADEKSQFLNSIPADHCRHPAITRLLHAHEHDIPTVSYELWTDKWRPRQAKEVLGNEDRALYLRAWLLALKLHVDSMVPLANGARDVESGRKARKNARVKAKADGKRPKVLRQRERPKKRRKVNAQDAWIVRTDEESEEEVEPLESEDELAYCEQTLSRLQRAGTGISVDQSTELDVPPEGEDDASSAPSSSQPVFKKQVFNTILLTGPSGCGKTAAVYACAEELGFDVFEVYPGIGERSGAALNKLIGEVGKNHLVRQQKPTPFGNASLNAQSAPADRVQEKGSVAKRRLRRIDSDDGLAAVQSPPSISVPNDDTTSVSQSIVLIEEVDVLYESDVNFWPTLVNIIKECRRPVILTCNDVSAIPIQTLPLQTTLTFSPCPEPLATSYLQSLSLVERCGLDRSSISCVYHGVDASSAKGRAKAMHIHSPDLRRSIHRLQLGDTGDDGGLKKPQVHRNRTIAMPPLLPFRSAAHSSSDDVQENLSVLKLLDRYHDTLSFVDSHLGRGAIDVFQNPMTICTPPADDELGYYMAHDDFPPSESAVHVDLSVYHRDKDIAEDAVACANSCFESIYPALSIVEDVDISTKEHASATTAVLHELKVSSDTLADDRSIFLDYEPWVRYMVAVDDTVLQAVGQIRKEGPTRMTRNSMKVTYQPYISLRDDAALRTFRASYLPA